MRTLTRLSFAKLAIAAPFVAKALVSDGSRTAAASDRCDYADAKCAISPQACGFTCQPLRGYAGCPVCVELRRAQVCATADAYCANGCSSTCRNFCSLRGDDAGCASCEVCDPE